MRLKLKDPKFDRLMELACLISPGWDVPIASLAEDLKIDGFAIRDLCLQLKAAWNLWLNIGAGAIHLVKDESWRTCRKSARTYFAEVYG